MTTPAITPTSTGFTTVRVFTAADPYHYTVDNRPIGDLQTNDTTLSGSGDAGRRGSLMNFLFSAVKNQTSLGTTRYVDGFLASSPGANQIRIGVGSVYESLALTTGDSRTIMKQSISPEAKDFAINTVSLTGGQSVIYAIEARFTDFSATTSSTFPLYDKDNTLLHAVMLFGDLQLQIVAGAAATTGSETPPSTTGGWFQMYHVTVNGATPTVYTKISYAAGFAFNSWGIGTPSGLTFTNLASGGATSSSVDDVPTTNFADAATQTTGAVVHLTPGSALVPFYNPYKPVKVKLIYSPSVTANNFRVQLSFAYLRATSAVTAVSYTSVTAESIAAGTADQLQVLTLTNTIANSGSIDQNTYDVLRIRLARIGADGADTNTGVLRVFSAQVFQ